MDETIITGVLVPTVLNHAKILSLETVLFAFLKTQVNSPDELEAYERLFAKTVHENLSIAIDEITDEQTKTIVSQELNHLMHQYFSEGQDH